MHKNLPLDLKLNFYLSIFFKFLGLLFAASVPIITVNYLMRAGLDKFVIFDPYALVTYLLPLVPAAIFYFIGFSFHRKVKKKLRAYKNAKAKNSSALSSNSVFNKENVED